MAATNTFDPGLVYDDATLTPAISATGQLLDVAGGTAQTVYDLNGNPLAGNVLTSNNKGYVGRFKAGIPFGVISFGSVLQPVVSIEALQSGPAAAAAATSAANAAASAATAITSANAAAAAAATSAQQVSDYIAAGTGGGGGLPAGTTLDTIPDGSSRAAITPAERTRLSGVQTGATRLLIGTTAGTAKDGTYVPTPAAIGAVQTMSGPVRHFFRTKAQGLPNPGSESLDGDWCTMDNS